MAAYLITWKPDGWPHEKLLALVGRFQVDGKVLEPWRFHAHRQAKPGDSVFALKQGSGAKGIFATGRIASTPYAMVDDDGGEYHVADVEFDRLVDPLAEFLVGEELTRAILPETAIRNQASGIIISDAAAQRLQSLIIGGTLNGLSVDDYVPALQALTLSDNDVRMLGAHYEADSYTTTPRQMSHNLGWNGPNPAKLHYGRLAGRIKEVLGRDTSPSGDPYNVGIIARASWPANGELQWEMYPAFAVALTRLLFRDVDAQNGSDDDLRERAYRAAGVGAGPAGRSMRNYYQRSEAVRDWVLRRAAGKCEACLEPAPFAKADGVPYLEPHHIERIADWGPDDPRFVGAVCPNCHRRIHHGLDGSELNRRLPAHVTEVIPAQPSNRVARSNRQPTLPPRDRS